MKNSKILIFAFLFALSGFLIAYFIWGTKSQSLPESSSSNTSNTSNNQIWTCAMHPQIRQSEPGLCPICEMELIPLEETSSGDPLVLQMTLEAVKLANIQTTIVGGGSVVRDSVLLLGKVKEDERLASSLVAHVPGRIEELFVTFTGEQVTSGQKLASIYSPELVTAQKELLEAIKFSGEQSDLAGAARKKLDYWKIPLETIREIEDSGQIRETFTVFAEKTGIVKKRRVSVGDYVKRGEILFDMVNLSRVWILFDAYEKDLTGIRIGDRIQFTTPAVPGRIFRTRVSFIDPVINPSTRVASVRTEMVNPGGVLKPEMFVRGMIQSVKATASEITVPKSAVMWTGPRSVVYVKIPGTEIPSFQFREVELGESVGDQYIIKDGVQIGEEIVTYGNFAIDAASQLNNQRSMMNRFVSLKEDGTGGIPDFTDETPETFQEQINQLGQQYIQLKDALIDTDADRAAEQAIRLLDVLSAVDMSLLQGGAHMFWMEQSKAIENHTRNISASDDVEDQRRQFGFLSEVMIQVIRAFGAKGDNYFVMYCPMAFDNEGADWLSLEEQVRNPYFGEKMMKCGSVTATISLEKSGSTPVRVHNH